MSEPVVGEFTMPRKLLDALVAKLIYEHFGYDEVGRQSAEAFDILQRAQRLNVEGREVIIRIKD